MERVKTVSSRTPDVGDKVEVVALRRADWDRGVDGKGGMVCLGDVGTVVEVVEREDRGAARRGSPGRTRKMLRVRCREGGKDIWLADFREDEVILTR